MMKKTTLFLLFTALCFFPARSQEKPATETLSFELYPNPAKDVVYIRMSNDDQLKQVDLIDLSGRVIRQVYSPLELIQITTDDLAAGVYFIRVRTKDGIANRTFFIEH